MELRLAPKDIAFRCIALPSPVHKIRDRRGQRELRLSLYAGPVLEPARFVRSAIHASRTGTTFRKRFLREHLRCDDSSDEEMAKVVL